ncbi:MAG: hypothetical protein IT486_01310 [Gammaproteobacteria bacterium]|nr:hypothetical protein [Gammaproteobacteria bacterium]
MPEADLKLAILAAYKRLLRPLIRILIRNGVSFGEFSEVAKDVYVEVASGDFQLPDKNMTQGRIAILTGLTRKEVNRLITERGKKRKTNASNLNRVARILSGWHTDPEFTGPYGLPLDVPYDSPGQSTFAELVRRYTGDMPARAMLDELLRIGVAIETDGGRIKVLTRTYLPKADAPESLDRLGNAVRNFVETMDFNRTEIDPDRRLLERTVDADSGIRVSDLPIFQTYVRERGQFLLEEIDDWLSKLEPITENEREPIVHTGVGIYHYIKKTKDNTL